ncbi:hypothetical protein FBU30_005371 [Linnemannia zychae]|nr:hypothetical protein FBU30_005371 [Linnemannia zychae]
MHKDNKVSFPVSPAGSNALDHTNPNPSRPRLPLECIELIMDMLEDDTATLAAMLQVDRQCFFAAVPRLYRDPFFRIQEIYRRKCHNIRFSAQRADADRSFRPTTVSTTQSEDPTSPVKTDTENIALKTSSPTLSHPSTTTVTDVFGTGHGYPLDFGPHFRETTWTSQYYLRHWTVIDLERLSTRGRDLPYIYYASFMNGDRNKNEDDGLFHYMFQNRVYPMIGSAEYLQRALLNRPGADRIVTLRIPVRRVRSFLDRRGERAPRPRTVAKSERKLEMTKGEEENGVRKAQEQTEAIADSSILVVQESQSAVDESLRPYCFMLNKLTNLRRIEVCNLSQNECDWESLRRALFAVEFSGTFSGIQLKDIATITKRPNKIRELILAFQATIGPSIDGILNIFGGLELLEIDTPSYQRHPLVTKWDPKLCRNLKVLRVGEVGGMIKSNVSLEDLGKFEKLEELRLRIDVAKGFQWIVDAKKEAKRASIRQEYEKSRMRRVSASMGGLLDKDRYVDPLAHCLPRLKRLGFFNRFKSISSDVLLGVTEAFGDQLEELVVCFSDEEGSIYFQQPMPKLTRLALRFSSLQHFNFKDLSQHCPDLEWIIIQHTWFYGSYPNNIDSITPERRHELDRMDDALVTELARLTRLRTVYFEGNFTMRGPQLWKLVNGCKSLERLGVHVMPNVTMEELAEIDTLLRSRKTRFPMRQRGVYRLPSRMSSYLDRDFHRRVVQWGYDLYD